MRPVIYNNKNQSSDLEDYDYIFEYDDSFGCKFTGGRTTWFNNDTNTIDMLQTSVNSAMYYLDALTNNNQAYCEHNPPQDYPLIASFGVDRLWQSKTKKN